MVLGINRDLEDTLNVDWFHENRLVMKSLNAKMKQTTSIGRVHPVMSNDDERRSLGQWDASNAEGRRALVWYLKILCITWATSKNAPCIPS